MDESPLQVLPSLATAVGLEESVFLQQLHWWLLKSNHHNDGRWWVYNTIPEWLKQFPWMTPRSFQRMTANLRERGLLITTSEYNKMGFDRTLWYTIDYSELEGLASHQTVSASRQNGVMDDDKMSPPIPLEYQEITNKQTASFDLLQEELPLPLPQTTLPLPETKMPPPVAATPPKAPTPHQELMVAVSFAIFGHVQHATWTAQQGARLGKMAKKLNDMGVTSDDVLAWLRGPWRDSYFGKQGQLPQESQFWIGMGQVVEQKKKSVEKPAFAVVAVTEEEWYQLQEKGTNNE
jgi:hypothetical protein